MRIESYSLQGRRESNEDQHYHLLNINGKKKKYNPINFISVFDGHGGKAVSKYLKDNLPQYFVKKFRNNIYCDKKKASKYFQKVSDILQKDLKTNHPRACNYSGSTACCGVHFLDKNKNPVLWIMNVGDSRAVLCNKEGNAVGLSKDHKPNSTSERHRIKQLGGKIRYDGSDWRIKDLSLSRAFGDVEATPYVTHYPEIFRYRLSKKDRFIILACDGLWDVFSNRDATRYVKKLQKAKFKGNYAKALAQAAIDKGSYDNVSVVLLFLK